MTETIAIGELSRRTGCNIETIRYYERIGLIPRARRHGRYRHFDDEDIGRLGFVRRARELGFTLAEVRLLLSLANGRDRSCRGARNVAAKHLTDVRLRIADLTRMERVLASAVRACDRGGNAGCPLINALAKAPLV